MKLTKTEIIGVMFRFLVCIMIGAVIGAILEFAISGNTWWLR